MCNCANLRGNLKWKRQRQQTCCSRSRTSLPAAGSSAAQVKVFWVGLSVWRVFLSSLITCVGSLCFHSPPGQPARPNRTFTVRFESPPLWDSALYGSPEGLRQYFSIHLVTVNYAGQTNKHYLLEFVWFCYHWWWSAELPAAAFCFFARNVSLRLSVSSLRGEWWDLAYTSLSFAEPLMLIW